MVVEAEVEAEGVGVAVRWAVVADTAVVAVVIMAVR